MPSFLELSFGSKKTAENITAESFCFTAESKKEKSLGSLFVIGEIKNLKGKCLKFLSALAAMIEKSYYQSQGKNPEERFRQALQKANEWIDGIIKKEQVAFSGNLNVTAFAITADMSLLFSKIGNLKTFLAREGKVFNFEEPSPALGVKFCNIISSQLQGGDKILTFSKNVFIFLEKEQLLKEIAREQKIKDIKKFLSSKRKNLKKLPGIGLIAMAKPSRGLFLPSMASMATFNSPAFRWLEKILPNSPKSRTTIKKILISLLILIIILPLGWLLFR